ncbi:MAG: succinate dehydrogenase cytochrome b subunit [Cyanobacteriota bacterium]|nr:succinate dehydrogenase cytochrome b subunit [Cyanobacteriota bacterium]
MEFSTQPTPPAPTAQPTALAGLALVLFLVLHLGGVGLALVDGPAFERYAAGLHGRWWLLVAELALAATGLGHGLLALVRRWRQRQARGPVAPARLVSRRRDGAAALSARTTALSGLLLAGFVALHLAELRWPRPATGQELAQLLTVLHQPGRAWLYGLAGLAVGWHLLHGLESAHRSLGWLTPANGPWIRRGGRAVAVAVGLGFAGLPLALLLQAGGP